MAVPRPFDPEDRGRLGHMWPDSVTSVPLAAPHLVISQSGGVARLDLTATGQHPVLIHSSVLKVEHR
jgi:hypothetical protein